MFSLEENGENLMISLELDLEPKWNKWENLTFLWSNNIIRT